MEGARRVKGRRPVADGRGPGVNRGSPEVNGRSRWMSLLGVNEIGAGGERRKSDGENGM